MAAFLPAEDLVRRPKRQGAQKKKKPAFLPAEDLARKTEKKGAPKKLAAFVPAKDLVRRPKKRSCKNYLPKKVHAFLLGPPLKF